MIGQIEKLGFFFFPFFGALWQVQISIYAMDTQSQ